MNLAQMSHIYMRKIRYLCRKRDIWEFPISREIPISHELKISLITFYNSLSGIIEMPVFVDTVCYHVTCLDMSIIHCIMASRLLLVFKVHRMCMSIIPVPLHVLHFRFELVFVRAPPFI
jgi:hypothetical protein